MPVAEPLVVNADAVAPVAAAMPERIAWGEGRVLLNNISWRTYENLLADLAEASAPRLTYDRGVLEIMSPLPEYEESNRTLARLVEMITEEWGVRARNFGSMTFRKEGIGRGFEPDSCFYLQNYESVQGKRRPDLATDPPPDLVIEVDITNPSLDKLPTYAVFGVPEIWRYDDVRVEILRLNSESGAYTSVAVSVCVPGLTQETLGRFIEDSKRADVLEWRRQVRAWAQSNTPAP